MAILESMISVSLLDTKGKRERRSKVISNWLLIMASNIMIFTILQIIMGHL